MTPDPVLVTCVQAIDCAECGFPIFAGSLMTLTYGWVHPTCLGATDDMD